MKKMELFDELWYAYEMQHLTAWTEEEKRILNKMERSEDELFPDLNEKQKDALENFRTSVLEFNDLRVKEAYKRGIRFATAYMIEALGKREDAPGGYSWDD